MAYSKTGYVWEDHNANAWAKNRLLELSGGVIVDGWKFMNMVALDVEAHRTVRRGKEFRTFEFKFKSNFEHDGIEGRIDFENVTHEGLSNPIEWEYNLNFFDTEGVLTVSQKKKVRSDAERDVIPILRQMFKTFGEEFMVLN